MGQEIERARVLLRMLTRDGVLKPEDVSPVYEGWVAKAGDLPFSRFLIDSGKVDSDRVRRALRLQAVQGLPHPESFTFERFEDLLIGQLGIEAGMLSPKLLRSVRAVQDKKVAQGKLRRLNDLLPRAGLDKTMLDLLHQHLQEQVLLCRGCLGRYPRKDLSELEVECPRCGANISAEQLEPSEELELSKNFSSEQQRALLASSECVMETLPVRARERSTASRNQPLNPMVPVVIVLLLVIGAGAIGIGVLDRDRRGVPVTKRSTDPGGDRVRIDPADPRKDPSGGDSDSVGDPRSAGAPTVARARQQDTEFIVKGRFADMLATWRAVKPVSGEDPAEVRDVCERRIAYLEKMVGLAERAEKGVAAASAGALTPTLERELVRVLRQAPPNHPAPFGALAEALRGVDQARADQQTQAALARLNRAREAVLGGDTSEAWARRAKAAARARPLMGVPLDGEAVDGVRVLAVSAKSFRVGTPSGERELTWDEQPLLSLRVFKSVADVARPPDQIELLRLALVAREPAEARSAGARLKLEAAAVDELLAAAPTSAPIVRVDANTLRLRYSLTWACGDLVPAEGTTTSPKADGLTLEVTGGECRVDGLEVATLERERKQPFGVAASCRLGAGARGPFLCLRLIGKSVERSYTARWSADRWSLVVRFGSEETSLASGTLAGGRDVRRARLEFTGKEIVFSLGGVALGRTNVWTKCKGVALCVGASAGPLRLEALTLEGSLDPASVEHDEREYAERIAQRMERLRLAQETPQTDGIAPLSVEDPQELAVADEALLVRLESAKTLSRGSELSRALDELSAIRQKDPNLLAAPYTEAYARVRQRDYSAALGAIDAALTKETEFPEAKALRGLTLALGGCATWSDAVDAGLEGRGDSAHGYLARAWWASRPRKRRDAGESDGSYELRLALALGLDDPLVVELAEAIREGRKLEATYTEREAGTEHLVHAATPQIAKEAAGRLDAILAVFGKFMGRDRKANRTPVAVLDSAAFARRAGAGRSGAVFDRRLGWLFLEGVPEKAVERSVARAVAAGYAARRYGLAPPWLEAAIVEYLAEAAVEGPPAHHVKILRNDGRWDAQTWSELFGFDRVGLQAGQQITFARCWILLNALKPRFFNRQLQDANRGRPTTPPELNVPKVEAAIAERLEAIKLPEDE